VTPESTAAVGRAGRRVAHPTPAMKAASLLQSVVMNHALVDGHPSGPAADSR
jgi:hypothetical protein